MVSVIPAKAGIRIKKINGFTLIESMLAITMSLFILGCLITVYLSAKKNVEIQSALNTLQENMRVAIKLLQTDIRLAGYVGCERLQTVTAYLPYELTPENKIHVYRDELSEIKPETDALIVRHANPLNVILLKNMLGFSSLYTTSVLTFSSNEILVIANCHAAEIFEVNNISLTESQQKITTVEPLHAKYEKFSEISRFSANTYFVGKTDRTTMKGKPVYALYVKDLFHRKTELIEGVDDMKIHYLIEENHAAKEVLATEVYDWSKVIGVLIQLTLSSQNYFSLQKTFYFYTALREI